MSPPELRLNGIPGPLECPSCEEPTQVVMEAPNRHSACDQAAATHGTRLGEPQELPQSPSTQLQWQGLQPTARFSPPRLFTQPLREISEIPLAAARAVMPEVLFQLLGEPASWQDFLVELFNNVLAIDLDMYHMPVNRGSNLCRYPEYTHIGSRPQCNLQVQPGTTARGHGEIRPMAGMDESFITRVIVDVEPNFLNILGGIVPDLEIDGFSSIDPPRMRFDWSRLPRNPVTDLIGGDLGYENPLGTGRSLATPFASLRQAPPDGHDYWMFHFNHVEDTSVAALQAGLSNRDATDSDGALGLGAMNLWAFLPTLGIDDPEVYEALGIPYNTFPRRFGDLIRLLWPQFTPEGGQIRESSQMINANSEWYRYHYLDSRGVPQRIPRGPHPSYTPHYRSLDGRFLPIPTQPEELERVNQIRNSQGLSPLRPGRRQRLPDSFQVTYYLDEAGEPHPIPQESNEAYQPHYLAADGRYRPVPTDPEVLARVNQGRAAQGMPPLSHDRFYRVDPYYEIVQLNREVTALNRREHLEIPLIEGRPRGSVIDWIGLDLARDLARFAATPEDELPYLTFRTRMRDVSLDFPEGRVHIHEGTEFLIRYALERRQVPGVDQVFPRQRLEVTFSPLDLGPVDIALPDGRFRAERLRAGRIRVAVPNLLSLIEALGRTDIPLAERLTQAGLEVVFEDVQVEGLDLGNGEYGFAIDEGRIGQIRFRSGEGSWHAQLRGIQANNLHVGIRQTDLYLRTESQSLDLNLSQQADGPLQAQLNIRGGIDEGMLCHPTLGALNFTTVDPGTSCEGETCPATGSITLSLTRDPEDQRIHRVLDFRLPYLGVWTPAGSVMEIARGSSSIRNAELRVNDRNVSFSGDLDLHAALPQGLGPGRTEFYGMNLIPNIQGLRASGRFRIDFSPEGWSLQGTSEDHPLNLGFRLEDTHVSHRPQDLPEYARDLPESQAIHSEVDIDSAQLQIEGFRHLRFQRTGEGEEAVNRFSELESGTFTLRGIEGNGSIWVNTFIWGFVRGLFPQLGGGSGRSPGIPDRAPLIQHLPEAVRRELETGDFIRLAGIRIDRSDPNRTVTHFDDFLVHLHEEGGRRQYGLIRAPQIDLVLENGQPLITPRPPILLNIFLHDPQRGGHLWFHRWPSP